jgi:hypothetical protein
MSRRIDTGEPDPQDKSGRPLYLGGKRGDDYLGRLAKYIPAEIVALYLFTSGMVQAKPEGSLRCRAHWIIFVINGCLVPLYFVFATTRGKKAPLWLQVILASLAFPVWVLAMGGPLNKCLPGFEQWEASVILAFVTVVFGFIKPKRGA